MYIFNFNYFFPFYNIFSFHFHCMLPKKMHFNELWITYEFWSFALIWLHFKINQINQLRVFVTFVIHFQKFNYLYVFINLFFIPKWFFAQSEQNKNIEYMTRTKTSLNWRMPGKDHNEDKRQNWNTHETKYSSSEIFSLVLSPFWHLTNLFTYFKCSKYTKDKNVRTKVLTKQYLLQFTFALDEIEVATMHCTRTLLPAQCTWIGE